jgi:hypothetical protein
MEKKLIYQAPAIKEYEISLENAILQASGEINPEVQIADTQVTGINQW